MSTDDVAALHEQRDVLLRSLRDLEQERATGEIGDDDYAALKDDYTARAAAVLRAIDAGRPSGPRRPRPRPRPPGTGPPGDRRPPGARPRQTGRPAANRPAANVPVGKRQRTLAVTLGVAFLIVALAGISVALFAGSRTPGEPATGSVPGTSTGASRVDEALALETDGKAVDALKLYDEILTDEPDNVEALAYRGWLLKRAGLADEALASLDRAVALDPTFADAHFFRGMVLYQDRYDPAGAVVEFQAFLANNPPADFVGVVQEVLEKAQAAADAKAAGTPSPEPVP